MKKIYISFSLIFLSGIIFSQNVAIKKADQLFGSYQYFESIKSYLQIINDKQGNQHVYQNLADSYYFINNPTEAAKWYEKALETSSDSEPSFRYAQSLKSLGKYAEANLQMSKFATLFPKDVRSNEFIKSQNSKINSNNAKEKYSVQKISFADSKSNDFGAVLASNNEVYLVSSRRSNKLDKWSNSPYFDIFKTTRNLNGSFSELVEVKELNSIYHDGPVTLSEDGNTMFFARDGQSYNFIEKDKKNNAKIGQLGIFKAIKINGKWEIKESLPINSTSYSVSHPSLSNDGKTLYFASNMPGGMGESDIWKIAITENGYSAPINLGNKINTPSREVFPFITSNNDLYFASTGWSGLGGLDIFKVENNSTIVNIGKPLNSEKDDFSFSLNSKLNIGYISSNRNGNDAIYEVTPVCEINMNVLVTDSKSGKNIESAKVNIQDENELIIYSGQTNTIGNCNLNLACDKSYTIQVAASNYENVSFPVTKSELLQIEVPVKLIPKEVIITDKEVLLGDVYFEFNKSNITQQGAIQLDKLVAILNSNPNMMISIKSHTDSKGNLEYNLKLSEQRAQATVQYIISKGIDENRIFGKGYGFTEPKINCTSNCTDEQNAINRRSEFIIIKK